MRDLQRLHDTLFLIQNKYSELSYYFEWYNKIRSSYHEKKKKISQ